MPRHEGCIDGVMLYSAYDSFARLLSPAQKSAEWWFQTIKKASDYHGNHLLREVAAEFEAFGASQITHTRPDFKITEVVDPEGKAWLVKESVAYETPFARLIAFKREGSSGAPKVLLVSPMSGHFSTLLSGTVKTLVQDHDVYITDWLNPRDIPLYQGRFGFNEYVDHLIEFLRFMGPDSHLMGVCQPTVACMAAAALMAQEQDPCEPASLILLAGPIDTRHNPTRVNELAQQNDIDWFKNNLVSTVPLPNLGAGRKVYPGFVQLIAFMSMNKERHLQAFKNMKELRANGDHEKADSIAEFYREYFAVMDLPAEFYLETVEKVFQKHELPQGKLTIGEKKVDCSAIRRPFLLTVEGERDDICGIGQTLAAQDLCSRMPMYKKTHLLQPGVGHYGVFNGKRWEKRIYPVVRDFIQSTV